MNKMLFTRGSTLDLPGEWTSGDPFGPNTTITAQIFMPGPREQEVYDCEVRLVTDRDFQIYASNTATALWRLGCGALVLTRTDPAHYPNGDDLVHPKQSVAFEVE